MLFFLVDAEFVTKQKKILALFYNAYQTDVTEEYFKIGKDYNIEANIKEYTVSKCC